MLQKIEDISHTIAACVTPRGEGAIAVIRISGPLTHTVLEKITRRQHFPSHKMLRTGLYTSSGQLLDEALAVAMWAPRSFTGEDVAEFHVHGSQLLVQSLLDALFELGCQPARPGEFSFRAFLHGKVDLTQAEAIADLIKSDNTEHLLAAVRGVQGGFSHAVAHVLHLAEVLLARWITSVDFPEYDTGAAFIAERDIEELQNLRLAVQSILAKSRLQQSQGRSVVLMGAPNAGKSSFFNALLKEERAIVDSEPGTTRDALEAEIQSEHYRWRIWDTAGVRETSVSSIEKRGISYGIERALQSDLVLWFVPVIGEQIWPSVLPEEVQRKIRIVASKVDLDLSGEYIHSFMQECEQRNWLFAGAVSAYHGEGIHTIREWMEKELFHKEEQHSAWYLIRDRHQQCLIAACQSFESIEQTLRAQEIPFDVLIPQLEDAIKSLGSILGKNVGAEVLEQIFADFCIGK